MASLAVQRLESLLGARKLDRTLTTAESQDEARGGRLAIGIPALDAALGGGWRQGELSELIGVRSSGRTSLLVATLAAATAAGGVVGLVDAFDRFDPPAAARAGVDLDRVLWVRGPALTLEGGRGPRSSVDRAVHDAVRAFDLIVRAGGFAVAALDLADVPLRAIRALPFTTWMRLAHANEGRKTVGLIAADEAVGKSARGVSVRLTASARWTGDSVQSRRLSAIDLRARIVSAESAGGDCIARFTSGD